MNPIDHLNNQLRELARKAFQDNGIELLIGYQKGEDGITKPAIFYSFEQVDLLIWDQQASFNLASLVRRFRDKKIGMIAQGCVSRSLVVLLNEGQINRNNLFIIGFPCQGVVDKNQQLHSACIDCQHPLPVIQDCLIEGDGIARQSDPANDLVIELNNQSQSERMAFFSQEMKKCIRCYACRQACPMCYCDVCFVDINKPLWLARTPDQQNNSVWNLTRMQHLAGRCVACGACDRACPEGVNLMVYLKKMNQVVKELYGYSAGLHLGEKPALNAFQPNDPDFFWGKEGV